MADVVVTKEVRTKLTADARELDAAMGREAREAERMAKEFRRHRREFQRFQAARAHMSEQEERDVRRMIALAKTRRREEAAEARRELVRRQRLERAAEAQRREEERINRALRRRRALLRGLGRAGRFLTPGPGMGALLAGGAVAGAGYGIARLVGAAASRQQDRLALASTLADAERGVGRRVEWSQAKTMADALTQSFRESARTLPGSYEDVQLAFRDIAEFARTSGATFRDIAELSANIAARQSFSGMQQGVVSRDVRQLLGGRYSAQEIQTPLLRLEGKRIAEMVRQGAAEEAFKEITRLLALTREQRRDFGDSFGGALETLKDQIKELMVIAGTPAMTWLTDKFKEWTAYITTHQDEVVKWVKGFGEDLVGALEAAASAAGVFVDVLEFLGDAWGVFKDVFLPGEEWLDIARRQQAAESLVRGSATGGPAFEAGLPALIRDLGPSAEFIMTMMSRGFSLDASHYMARDKIPDTEGAWYDALNDPANLRNPKVNVDARGARITIQQRLETDDPERVAGASLGAAFGAVVARPLTGTFGLGSLALSVGD